MAWRRACRAVGALALSLLLAGGFAELAAAETTVAFRITDHRISGASGMARDPGADLYWVVNNSGSRGVAYGVGSKGDVRGTLHYRADPVDVEAVAVHQDRLYVADIGDHAGRRRTVTVYYFDQPRASGLTVPYRSWDFRYPDGPHDAGTLLVSPDGRLSIVTKEAHGGIYQAPTKPTASTVNPLTRVDDAPAFVTDGVLLPGGRQLALLTGARVLVVDAQSGRQQASAPITGQPQPESVAVSLDGRSLLITGKGKQSPVIEVPVPGGAGASPTATPQDPGGADPPDEPGPTAAPNQRGTLLALGLAGLVAVVAGLVVGVVRRP